MNGYFFPLYYLYSVTVIAIRIASCVMILYTPTSFKRYMKPKGEGHVSVLSIMNAAAEVASFSFGCLIVATLFNTVQILKYAHLEEIEFP